jgi:hypothetical protein
MRTLSIMAFVVALASCQGGCGGGGDQSGPARELVPGEVCRTQMTGSLCPVGAIWRKPLEFQHCKVPLDDEGMCRYEDLEHNVPGFGELIK